TFVHDALCRIFRGTESANGFDVLAAVVDRLPSPSTPSRPRAPQKPGRLINSLFESGREGVAFLVGESAKMAPDLWTARQEKDEADTMTFQQRSTISFAHQPREHVRSRITHGSVPRPYVSHKIELPLANTIFNNGRISTMSASHWMNLEAAQQTGLSRIKNSALQHQRILMPFNAAKEPSEALILEAPLLTLTVPQIIASAMGNIIRQLYTDNYASETIPASQGLERAVTEFFARRDKSPQHVAVWALVTPKERWVGEPSARGRNILSWIQQGSRLHRVLSGGGGYGKKQGLLSLDPDAAYDLRRRTSPFGTGEDLHQEEKDALGQVVNPGDVIQFFIYPPDIGPIVGGEDHLKIKYQGQNSNRALEYTESEFGTIPSTIDSIPTSALEAREQHEGSTTEYSENYFGALSEQGLSLTIDTHGPEGMDCIGAERVGRVVQTKLDVPFTRFRLRTFNMQRKGAQLDERQR
ncbi:MAG: hypothetical protein M1830_001268, partial [Pleopsidium flavum]